MRVEGSLANVGEWLVTIEERSMAELEDGTPAPVHRTDPDLAVFFPVVYRDITGIKLQEARDAERLAILTDGGALSMSGAKT